MGVWVTDAEGEAAKAAAGIEGDWMTMEQVAEFHTQLPYLNRDHGAGILQIIAEQDPGALKNEWDFAANSLFCEYAYVIDLDKRTFEVYKGFNKEPVPEGERFATLPGAPESYYPVKLFATFSLSELPTDKGFLKATAEHEEDL